MAQNRSQKSNQKSKQKSPQLTYTHIIVTAIVMLVAGYLFGRFSAVMPGLNVASAGQAPSVPNVVSGTEIAALRQAADNAPESAAAWTALANAYFDSGRYSDAVDAYTRSLEINGRDPNVWTDRGIMYRRLGNPRAAIDDFETAAALDSTHQFSRFNKGIVLYYDLEDTPAARVAFEDVLRLNPNFQTPTGLPLRDFMATLK